MKPFLVILSLVTVSLHLHAQTEEEDDESERVKYALIMPEEKTPEMVKPEENNPFEAAADSKVETESGTEENQVRDMLVRMPVGGAVSGINGMRVMLGGMRLEAGMQVPPVIPDQQVVLRVKSINASAIELVWVEKKPTGLPPKLLVIPMDGAPTVRYRMPAGPGQGTDAPGEGSIGTMRPGVSAFSPARVARDRELSEAETRKSPLPKSSGPQPPAQPAKPSSPPSELPAAAVLRMLFGNHSPEAK